MQKNGAGTGDGGSRGGWARRAKVTIGAGAAVALAATGVAFGRGLEPMPEHVPWTKRCPVELRAYEDASASLFCEGKRKPFAIVENDDGRIRFFPPR
jgi:hypothetical protein